MYGVCMCVRVWCVCVCVCGVYVYAVCLWCVSMCEACVVFVCVVCVGDQRTWELILSTTCVPRFWLRSPGLAAGLYRLTHLAGPTLMFYLLNKPKL